MGCANTKLRSQLSSRSQSDFKQKNTKYLAFSNQYKNGIPQLQNIQLSTIIISDSNHYILQRRKNLAQHSV